jgi:hypothetical protein
MRRTEALPTTPFLVPDTAQFHDNKAPLLIQVPRVRTSQSFDSDWMSFRRSPGITSVTRRPGRRLRKEVRIAGGVLLILMPIGLAWSQLAPAGTPRIGATPRLAIGMRSVPGATGSKNSTGSGWATDAELNPTLPPVLLSIETAGAGSDSDCESPVLLPGYLLPDDNHEELAHEGS